MKLYLAGITGAKKWLQEGIVKAEDFNCLESFYSLGDWMRPFIPRFKSFLLDSGAFTFMNNARKHGSADWNSYADRYADFIKENHIRHYFELDWDGVIGLVNTEKLRNRIEARSGMQCIPVWHRNRGKEYFLDMVRNYAYVAVGGGVVTKEIPLAVFEQMFPWFIRMAHENGARIHGLGYTKTENLERFRFDSTDSTTWTAGSRFGEVHFFRNRQIEKELSVIKGIKHRSIRDMNALPLHNFNEWVKLSKYLERI